MKDGLVSIIIPVFNRPKALQEAVASAQQQTYGETEILIIDDGSTDDTPTVAAELAARAGNIRVLLQKNGGPGSARECGRLSAHGEFLQYLDSDDLLLPDKLATQVARMRQHPEAVLTYGTTRHVLGGRTLECTWKPNGVKIDTIFPATLNARYWETSAPLYRAEMVRSAGGWSDLRAEEDWEYDCRIGTLLRPIDFIPDEVLIMRHDGLDRLSAQGGSRPTLMQRARAHERVFIHARRAGVRLDSSAMKQFARSLFMLARKCGGADLPHESMRLLHLARSAGVENPATDLAIYIAATRIVGPTLTGKTSNLIDELRSKIRRGKG